MRRPGAKPCGAVLQTARDFSPAIRRTGNFSTRSSHYSASALQVTVKVASACTGRPVLFSHDAILTTST